MVSSIDIKLKEISIHNNPKYKLVYARFNSYLIFVQQTMISEFNVVLRLTKPILGGG